MILGWRTPGYRHNTDLGLAIVWRSNGSGGAVPPIVMGADNLIDMYRTFHIKSAVFGLLSFIGVL